MVEEGAVSSSSAGEEARFAVVSTNAMTAAGFQRTQGPREEERSYHSKKKKTNYRFLKEGGDDEFNT